MLILAEKPDVAKKFANVLNCKSNKGFFNNEDTVITYCVGHLFRLAEPNAYGQELPIIPNPYITIINPPVAEQANLVTKLLRQHRNDTILLATDADREGEVIGRECLAQAEITDFSKIKRFWVSEALTKEVIINGIKNAKPLNSYNFLAEQGFARSHSDWLVGMNFSRYVSNLAKRKLPVGRVQTALLEAIYERCNAIENFVPKTYFEHYGIFTNNEKSINAIYFENEKTRFDDSTKETIIRPLIGLKASIKEKKEEEKIKNPPELYNLTALQQDSFSTFEYTAKKTLSIVQSLYETLECVSYPRTPSRVMGSGNVQLVSEIFDSLSKAYPKLLPNYEDSEISLSNKRCFNDAKLEAHHALIPLKPLPNNASEEQRNVYNLILERFSIAFLSEYRFMKTTYILSLNDKTFRVAGTKTIKSGFKDSKYFSVDRKKVDDDRHVSDDEQNIDDIDFENLFLKDIKTEKKHTKPPKYFNEASILGFMKNPYMTEETDEQSNKKLVSLGTEATRHTFIPKLLENGYIDVQNKKILCTENGKALLSLLKKTSLKDMTDIDTTTKWEELMNDNPKEFEIKIKEYVASSVVKTNIETSSIQFQAKDEIKCPLCGKPIVESEKSFFCTGYKDGCKFKSLWKKTKGTSFLKADVKKLCNGEKTTTKKCTNKDGKNYECKFVLNANYELEAVFENKGKK